MKSFHKKRTWVFFYATGDNRLENHVFGVADCIYPTRTALYKLLKKARIEKGYTCTGYTSDVNDVHLIWPQSVIPTTQAMIDERNRIMEEDEAEDMNKYSHYNVGGEFYEE